MYYNSSSVQTGLEKRGNMFLFLKEKHAPTFLLTMLCLSDQNVSEQPSSWVSWTSRSLYVDLSWATEYYLYKYLGLKLRNVSETKKGKHADYPIPNQSKVINLFIALFNQVFN